MELSGPPTSVFYNKLARVSCEEQRCRLKSCEKRQNDYLTLKLWGIRRDVKTGLLRNVRTPFFSCPGRSFRRLFFHLSRNLLIQPFTPLESTSQCLGAIKGC